MSQCINHPDQTLIELPGWHWQFCIICSHDYLKGLGYFGPPVRKDKIIELVEERNRYRQQLEREANDERGSQEEVG